ncbi:MAG: hypothetical protein ACI8RZ_007337 [Myxococcota bacterium]|jgi:hypothetical protein
MIATSPSATISRSVLLDVAESGQRQVISRGNNKTGAIMNAAQSQSEPATSRRRLLRLKRGLDYADDISEYNRIIAEIRQLRASLIRVV